RVAIVFHRPRGQDIRTDVSSLPTGAPETLRREAVGVPTTEDHVSDWHSVGCARKSIDSAMSSAMVIEIADVICGCFMPKSVIFTCAAPLPVSVSPVNVAVMENVTGRITPWRVSAPLRGKLML